MMGLGKSDIETMSLWEYEARLWHWNEAHRSPDDVGAPDPEITQRLVDLANSDPRLTRGGDPKRKRRQPA